MSLQPRHRQVMQVISAALGLEDDATVDAVVQQPRIRQAIDRFFAADGPTRLILGFSSEAEAESEAADLLSPLGSLDEKESDVHTDAVFFVKKCGLRDTTGPEIDPSQSGGQELSFGVVRLPLQSLEVMIRCVYRPLLEKDHPRIWGKATEEQRKEFVASLETYLRRLQEHIRSLTGGLELRKPDARMESSAALEDPALISSAIHLLEEWCFRITAYLEDSDRSQWETGDSGPETELQYWRGRMQRLTSITEQLKSKACKCVIVLLNASVRVHNPLVDNECAAVLLARWRDLDVHITEALNEAKDNVKYLSTLERFFEVLYGTDLKAILDSIPSLMNALKMIHTIARYFSTTERMTRLFMKVTNQMIHACKLALSGGENTDRLWDVDTTTLLDTMELCLRINEEYQVQYRATKQSLLTLPKGKQFDFSESQIFGRFELFCRRILKLLDIFSAIQQFAYLKQHKLEGIEPLLQSFSDTIRRFRGRGHNLLDYKDNRFDQHFLELSTEMSELEVQLQDFIDRSFDHVSSIEQSLGLLKKYQQILHRDSLRNDLESKFSVIFHNYGLELNKVEQIYESFKHAPPIARNMPPVTGNILWARHLLRRIEEPMRRFQVNPAVLATKEAKKVIKAYNNLARTLIAFEYLWYEAWVASIPAATAGLQATLIIRHQQTGKLFVNFDPSLFQLVREAKCLERLDIEIPEAARMVVQQEEKFKSYYNDLRFALSEYERITAKIIPVTHGLLRSHLQSFELKLRPGIVTLTWTSLNIDSYKASIEHALRKLDELVYKINDIVENRIQKNLKAISRTLLIHLPQDSCVTLDEFVVMQETSVKEKTEFLRAKNLEVEIATEDLLNLIRLFPLDHTTSPCSREELEEVRQHFNLLTYQAVLNATRQSLNAIKKRVCARRGAGILFVQRPFFEVDVQLSVPSVRLNPSLDDIQRALNRSAVSVLSCAKTMWDWGQSHLPITERTSLFEKLGKDVEIIKTVLLLTGALHGTKNQVHDYLQSFRVYDWLWKNDKEVEYRKFMAKGPAIADFEQELLRFVNVEEAVSSIAPTHSVGALLLNTANIKAQLRNESRQWKILFSNKIHQQANDAMKKLYEYIRATTNRVSMTVENVDSLRYVMNVIKEVREKESSIEQEISPIIDMYQMLEHYLPGSISDTDEVDQKLAVRGAWAKLVSHAESVTNNLSSIQGTYKRQLLTDIREFTSELKTFRTEFEQRGPMVPGIAPEEAISRLRKFKEDIVNRERKMEVIRAGEELFALRPTNFPDLVKTRKELALLDQLYGLYSDAINCMTTWAEMLWVDVTDHLTVVQDTVATFDQRCKRLPKRLREWKAFDELREKIQHWQILTPVLQDMAKPSIKTRHWIELSHVLNAPALLQPVDSLKLKMILDTCIVDHIAAVLDVCEGADKQLQIETKLTELNAQWQMMGFEFVPWKTRDTPVLKNFGAVIEQLEESQLVLQSLLSMRHVAPFKEEAQSFLTVLSDTADVLELWVKVQLLWTSLESVFLGGDIAKQMPLEAKKFVKLNKDWEKLMLRASATKIVVTCCTNEVLRNTLPNLYNDLERCQKSLEGYLEQKRGKFPRFYFVSNPALLVILSQGSDPLQMQPYYEKVFDSVSHVVHSERDKTLIKQLQSIEGRDMETIHLHRDVKAVGNIEDWLSDLEVCMQSSMKALCEVAAYNCISQSLRQFVDQTCAQLALLGIQFSWTSQCAEAISRSRNNKNAMGENSKLQGTILQELSAWCLEDLGSAMNRRKIETLVTVQLHQREVFAELVKQYKDKKLTDTNDFEWLKQTRFYWQPNVHDKLGPSACVISICDINFQYVYEYLGCKERLVITPLTDRCYIALSQALGMHLGGAPAGPAGTGKTETVKDLGRSLGIFVVVTNCTDQQRHSDIAKIFKGLCQAGAWGCFDEFNRIELPVLSVVAQQILAITNTKRVGASTFVFPGESQPIKLNSTVGYFVTMNPGYQGRQELPENLKVLFRGVAMMVPDSEMIMRVKLCSVGYQTFTELSRKFKVLYTLCEQQLSKQKHYDFGLRNILSVLRTAGQAKREHMTLNEESVIMNTLRDMNLSKLVAQDVSLFLSLLSDIFPGVSAIPSSMHLELDGVLSTVLAKQNLVAAPGWMMKLKQLHDTALVRHGIMLVGPAGAGKTAITHCLHEALSQLTSLPHRQVRMNPKAIRAEEMFGETEKTTGEWVDGIFAAMWSKYNDRTRKDVVWIVCDGPVDALWIENLNTVLDDNKILTLANGDRIPMTDNVKLLFEVEDLRNASPATVSRAGVIFVSASDLDWGPVVDSWIKTTSEHFAALLSRLVQLFVGSCNGPHDEGHLFKFLAQHTRPSSHIPRVGYMQQFTRLMDGLLESTDISATSGSAEEDLRRMFVFALMWTVGALLEPADRQRLQNYLVQIDSSVMPPRLAQQRETLFDYWVNPDSLEWEHWPMPAWQYPNQLDCAADFFSLTIPTTHTARTSFFLQQLHKQRLPVLVAGPSGTGKTATILMFADNGMQQHPQQRNMLFTRFSFSAATTPRLFQTQVEAELDKRGGKSFGPPGGRQMTLFIDDLNMPCPNVWGDQPTLELFRQLLETKGFCFLDKDKRGDLKYIEDLQFVVSMQHPRGGKQDISIRLKRHFFVVNVELPERDVLCSIFGQMLQGRFAQVKQSTQMTGILSRMPGCTARLLEWARCNMLPSPTKFHYIFNMRELSRVFQGVLRCPLESVTTSRSLVQLWRHECSRVFGDKLTSAGDQQQFEQELLRATQALLQSLPDESPTAAERHEPSHAASRRKSTFAPGNAKKGHHRKHSQQEVADPEVTLEQVRGTPSFVDFLREDEVNEEGVILSAPRVYEEAHGGLEQIQVVAARYLQQFNEQYPSRAMSIILFDDALRHIIRIARILGMPRGNVLLVGVGGSGKESLARLAAYIVQHTLFTMVASKAYTVNSLLDDLRALYKACGQQDQKIAFLIKDNNLKNEAFLDVFNAVLTTGEVPSLLPKDEVQFMAAELRNEFLQARPRQRDTSENLVRFFVDRVRANLHLVLCVSPGDGQLAERAQRYPGLLSGCTVDWCLPWPEDALVAVSSGLLNSEAVDCSEDVRKQLVTHMGVAHRIVVDCCAEYFSKLRRLAYQTPKSFLTCLKEFEALYALKSTEVQVKASRVATGLEKLAKGADDVRRMKVALTEEEQKLCQAEEAANEMLSRLEVSSMEAKTEADAVAHIATACEADRARVLQEKADAEEDLAKAQPFVEEAERAVNSIKPNDLNELKKMAKPADILKLIFDCVALLKMEKLVPVQPAEITMGVGKDKRTFQFIKDSYKIAYATMLTDARFLQNIFHFSKYDKDFINDETVELMMPYLELEGFNPAVARNASKAAEGLCTWCRAMADYHNASKVVKPKLEALRLAEARLADAERELYKAETKLQACQDVLARLQADFDAQIASKRRIEKNAASTRERMEKATALIEGLASERARWTSDQNKFADYKRRLVGDCALAAAFIAYCGPFNQDFREYVIHSQLASDLKERDIPMTAGLSMVQFLVDPGTIGEWNLHGLPTDTLSIQNGILVTRAKRYPLLIDPQGQALPWIQRLHAHCMPAFGVTTFSNSRFREQLEHALAEGLALVVTGVNADVDPIMIPVLEQMTVTKGSNTYMTIQGKLCDFNPNFRCYMTTRMPNPHFSPELQARTTVVDFTVTQFGLEEQLLGHVIQREQRPLEEQLKVLLEEVTNNTKALLRLDEQLLERLAENTGNLLDDDELVDVLAVTKAKAIAVNEKLSAASEMRKGINEKRELYRPVATRGSVLYFSIVDMARVNKMYQVSLDQFRSIFDRSIEQADKAATPAKRVYNIIDALTYNVYRYINRGLYESDKVVFRLLILLKAMMAAGKLQQRHITLLTRGAGAGNKDSSSAPTTPFEWLDQQAWLNLSQLISSDHRFATFTEDIVANEAEWQRWCNDSEPEKRPIPDLRAKLSGEDEAVVSFFHTLFVRCLREDRVLPAVHEMIRQVEFINVPPATNGSAVAASDMLLRPSSSVVAASTPTSAGGAGDDTQYSHSNAATVAASGPPSSAATVLKLPMLGPRFVEPVTDTVEAVYNEMNTATPAIYLLSAGADPTNAIETLARKKKCDIQCVSMGEGQEPVALRALTAAAGSGSWVLLQNCHLGLQFMESLEDILKRFRDTCHSGFRVFLSCEPHKDFPISLLQMSLKVTDEPPKGLRAGLLRSYTSVIDQDRLDRNEADAWRILLYALCFLHSVVQERKKFGALGWSVPYEFNDGDLHACMTFLERHLEADSISWPTVQYMVAEVQYGGKITDDMDRRLFVTYTGLWISPTTLLPGFMFDSLEGSNNIPHDSPRAAQYSAPSFTEHDDYLQFITSLPEDDGPEIVGLHPNADLRFRSTEANQMLSTLAHIQPRQHSNESGAASVEDTVLEKCSALLESLPEDYSLATCGEMLRSHGEQETPTSILCYQEIQRFQSVLDRVKHTLLGLMQAIKGEVVSTSETVETMYDVFDGRVPQSWLYTATKDEVSWLAPNLGAWFASLLARDEQYRRWLAAKPLTYWLGGLFNQQGFFTAVRQKITRTHKADKWALADVVTAVYVSDISSAEKVKDPPREGVYLTGLFLDGASWSATEASLVESQPKQLFASLPIVHVTAVTKTQQRSMVGNYGPFGGYECPLYKYPVRTDRYMITHVMLSSQDRRPEHWALRGVAMLCDTQ